MSEDRIINPELEDIGEERLENTLRPQTLEEYIGQDKVKENITRYLNNINKNWKTTAFDYERIRKDKEHLLNQLHITIADLIYATTKNGTCLYYIDFIRQYIIL